MEPDKLKVPVTKSREIIIVSSIGGGQICFSKESRTIFSYVHKVKGSIERIDNSEQSCFFHFILGLLGLYTTEKSSRREIIQPPRFMLDTNCV